MKHYSVNFFELKELRHALEREALTSCEDEGQRSFDCMVAKCKLSRVVDRLGKDFTPEDAEKFRELSNYISHLDYINSVTDNGDRSAYKEIIRAFDEQIDAEKEKLESTPEGAEKLRELKACADGLDYMQHLLKNPDGPTYRSIRHTFNSQIDTNKAKQGSATSGVGGAASAGAPSISLQGSAVEGIQQQKSIS